MIDRGTKLRWRRKVRQRQRQIEGIGSQTEENIDKHFFRRLGRLYEVRRFIFAWVLLLILLIGAVVIQTRALGDYYLKLVPVPGGIYSEGIIGSYTNANPIFASNDVNSSVSRLIFSGLLTYDGDNKLVNDLAESWSVDATGKVYTFKLKDTVKWHDGEPLTADDVVYTFKTIQNPDTRSPYFSAWQGIKVTTKGTHEVSFVLPNILASFPYSLTTGILPRHILAKVQPADLRGSLFNTVEPVGTGPFKWKDIEIVGDTAEQREQRIALSAYNDYHLGDPKLDEFIIRAFLDETALIKSFQGGKLNAIAGALSRPLEGDDTKELNVPLTGAVMTFFNTESPLLADAKVRRALTMAVNQDQLIRNLSYESVPVKAPLLPEHIGYRDDVVQYGFDQNQAKALLEDAGWKADPASGMRTKDGKKLVISLKTLSSAEYANVANQLQTQWRAVGVELDVESLTNDELQSSIDERNYDALVYGIIMGLDPDQFAYWHSSQADVRSQRRLNFSEYKNKVVDDALEAGRTRLDPDLRSAKYLPFLQTWREDAPAVAHYRPRFIYTTYGKLYNFNDKAMNSPIDRLNTVHDWMIRTDRAVE